MSEYRLASVSRLGPIVASATLLTLLSIEPVLCQPHTFIPPFPGSWPIDNGYRTVCSLNVPQTTTASCRNSIDRDRSDLNTLRQSRLAGTIKDSSSYATLRLRLEKHLDDSLQVLRSLQSRQMTPLTQSVPRQSSYLLSPEQGGQGNYQDVNWAGDEVRMAYTASAASESIIGVSGTITVPAISLPPGASCDGKTAVTYYTSWWLGVGGDSQVYYQGGSDGKNLTPGGTIRLC